MKSPLDETERPSVPSDRGVVDGKTYATRPVTVRHPTKRRAPPMCVGNDVQFRRTRWRRAGRVRRRRIEHRLGMPSDVSAHTVGRRQIPGSWPTTDHVPGHVPFRRIGVRGHSDPHVNGRSDASTRSAAHKKRQRKHDEAPTHYVDGVARHVIDVRRFWSMLRSSGDRPSRASPVGVSCGTLIWNVSCQPRRGDWPRLLWGFGCRRGERTGCRRRLCRDSYARVGAA